MTHPTSPELTPLSGRLIAVPEARELDIFASLLERRGARVLRAPLVTIRDAPDPQPVLRWLHDFSRDRCQFLVLLTGEGLRRLLSCLDRHEPTLRPAFLSALAQVHTITRGPKPARALKELGLAAHTEAPLPTTAGVVTALRSLVLQRQVVGVQLYGTEPNLPLQDFLVAAGAEVRTVAPYVYANATDDAAVRDLLTRLASGAVDAIAFTSKVQVDRLFAVATPAEVLAALAATQIVAVGPLVAAALTLRGAHISAVPDSQWFMKPLATQLAQLLKRTADSGIHAMQKT